jgi:hypothetical protein
VKSYERFYHRGDRCLLVQAVRARHLDGELFGAVATESSTAVRSIAEVLENQKSRILHEGAPLADAFRIAEAYADEWMQGGAVQGTPDRTIQ